MKKNSLLLVVFSLIFTSCVVRENLTFNQDNSGKLTYKIDMSKMMEMAGDKMSSGSNKKAKSKNKTSKDIDSTFSFKEIYAEKKDSISKLSIEEQARLKKMERYSGRIIMNEDEKKMEIHFFADFKSPSELQDLVSPINALSQMDPSASQMANETPTNEGITSYLFNGNKFEKKVVLKPSDNIEKGLNALKQITENEENKNEEEELDDFSKEFSNTFKMLYVESSYEMTVGFPRKVKSVSISGAKISPDGKTVTVAFPMENYMESKDMNFEVELE